MFRLDLTPKDRVLAGVSLALVALFIGGGRLAARNFVFSYTNSVGYRFFRRVECPPVIPRWQFVEVIPYSRDPFVPHAGWMHLVKKAGCLPGEQVLRQGLDFWCVTREGLRISLGRTKLKARDGRPLEPFTYSQGEKASVEIRKGSIFVVGDLQPHSYDSRYFGPVSEKRVVSCLKPLF